MLSNFLDIDVEHAYIMAKALKSYQEHRGGQRGNIAGSNRPMTAAVPMDLKDCREELLIPC